MEYKDNAQLDTGSVRSGGGGGGRGGGIAVGGIGGLIMVIIAMFLGLDPGAILGGGQQGQPESTAQQTANSECKTGADVDKNPDCRWFAYMTSLNDFWPSQFDSGFQETAMQTFSGGVNTACGQANSQVGPFYCPGDSTIYIDTNFTGELLNQLGAKGGPAAEAYIVAHEYGHHIQNLTGVLSKSQDGQTGAGSNAVRVELQADCYAGAWFRWAKDNPDDVIEGITQDDLNRIVDAAKAVGDDHIQQRSGGGVNPDGWTHGSSAQRKYWVAQGFNSGVGACDTFKAKDLGPEK